MNANVSSPHPEKLCQAVLAMHSVDLSYLAVRRNSSLANACQRGLLLGKIILFQ